MTTQITYQAGDLVHTGDYYVYQVIKDKGNTVEVIPAWGYPLQWGEQEGMIYEYKKVNLHPGESLNS